jgi:hypothetical protein
MKLFVGNLIFVMAMNKSVEMAEELSWFFLRARHSARISTTLKHCFHLWGTNMLVITDLQTLNFGIFAPDRLGGRKGGVLTLFCSRSGFEMVQDKKAECHCVNGIQNVLVAEKEGHYPLCCCNFVRL